MIKIASPLISEKGKANVIEVLESGMLASGSWVTEFEEKFSNYVGTDFAVATSSGTTALHVALLAVGIKEGDIVLTTPFTFIASANSILFCGAKPVFVDIEPKTFNLDPAKLEASLEQYPKAKAVMVVHLYGLACDMPAICEIARKHNLLVIEDCAQAHGAAINRRKVGTFGDVAAFSFYPTKNMTTGEGGIVVTNQKEVAERCKKLINHGRSGRFTHDSLGYNYRMTNIAAAIGLAQLERLDKFNEKRIANASYLSNHLNTLEYVTVPFAPPDFLHVFHQYTVKVPSDKRAELIKWLEEHDVDSAIIYPYPLHKQPLYANLGYDKEHYPMAEEASEEVLSIPVHPRLTQQDLETIVSTISTFPG